MIIAVQLIWFYKEGFGEVYCVGGLNSKKNIDIANKYLRNFRRVFANQ